MEYILETNDLKKQYKDFTIIGDSAGANLAIYLLHNYHKDNVNIICKTNFNNKIVHFC